MTTVLIILLVLVILLTVGVIREYNRLSREHYRMQEEMQEYLYKNRLPKVRVPAIVKSGRGKIRINKEQD